jgi:spermidine synthase
VERRGSITFGILAVGAASLWAQVMAARAGLVAFGGNELVLALLFAFWLAAVGIGAFAGGFLVRRTPRNLDLALAAIFLLFALLIYVDAWGARALRGLVGLPAGECPQVWQILAGTFGITAPVSFMVGLVFPFLTAARRSDATSAGEVYGLEAAGSLAAGCIGTYVFLSEGRDDLLVFGAIALLLAAAFAMLRGRAHAKWCLLALGVWCLLGSIDLAVLTGWADGLRWRGLLGGFRLLESAETPYGNLSILGRSGQYQLYLDGQLGYAFPDVLAEEIEAHIAAAQCAALGDVLVIGGKPGLVRELAKYGPRTLKTVWMDPAVERLALPFESPATRRTFEEKPSPIVVADPRAYLAEIPGAAIDLVLLGLPEPSSVALNRFYTVEFFREARRVLRPGGVLACSLEAGIHLRRESMLYAATCLRTLKEVFPEVVVSAGGTLRFFASAAPGIVTTDGEKLARRFSSRAVPTEYFQGIFFTEDEAFRPPMLELTDRRLAEGLPLVEPERDARPKLFMRHLVLFARTARSALADVFETVLSLRVWQVLPWALIAGAAALALRKRRAAPVVVAVGATGLWAMALELVLLVSFQAVSGSLYHKIGMVTGAFMCGLSAGAWRGRKAARPRRALLVTEAACVAGALVTPLIVAAAPALGGSGAELVFYVWVAFLGAATGFEFSVANRALGAGEGGAINWIAAVTDGADHLGACGGAFVTGLVLLPAVGTGGVGIFLAILKAGTLAGILRWRGRT